MSETAFLPRDASGTSPRTMGDCSPAILSIPKAVDPACTHTTVRCGWAAATRWWFQALDGRCLDVGGSSWTAQVMGIHEVRPHLWIQIEFADTAMCRVVLHVTIETRLDEALAAIARAPVMESGPQIVHVRPATNTWSCPGC